MIAFLLALQTVDHLDRDFTQEGLSPLAGTHTNVRVFTVTTLGEVVPDGAAVEVRSQAVVVDGVVAGGSEPVVIGGGGMAAGRYPVLLGPPDGNLLFTTPVYQWYASSATPGLSYKLVVEGPGGPYTVSGLTATSAGPLPLPAGEFHWRVEAVSPLGVFASETWSFVVSGGAPPTGGGPPPDDGPPLTFPGDDDGDGTVGDPTPTITWDPVPGAEGYNVTITDTDGNPIPCAGGFTTDTSWTPPDTCPLPDGAYTVTVQPVDGAGNPFGDPLAGVLVVDTEGEGPVPGAGPHGPQSAGAAGGRRRSKSFCQFLLTAGGGAGPSDSAAGWLVLAIALALAARFRSARAAGRGPREAVRPRAGGSLLVLFLAGFGAAFWPAARADAQGRIEVRGGTVTVTSSGALESAAGVTVAGSGNPKFILGGTGILRVGSGGALLVGDDASPGTFSASGASPTLTTTGTAGTTFYGVTITSTGTISVSALKLYSTDLNGLTLKDGGAVNNGTAGALSGITFDWVQPGGTCVRFLHAGGSFSVSDCTFLNTGGSNPYNISTAAGFAGSVDASVNNGGPRAGSSYENDHGAGTDNGATSTINWGGGIQAPTGLQVEGATSGTNTWTGIADPLPEFAAMHNHSGGIAADKYRIQVATSSATDGDGNFTTGVVWESGTAGSTMSLTGNGTASPQISYGGGWLSWNATYYWHIRFWDTGGVQGPWSLTGQFAMAVPGASVRLNGSPGKLRWTLIGVPHGNAGASISPSLISGLLGGSGPWYRWNEATGSYVLTTTLKAGYGYYIKTQGEMPTLNGGQGTGSELVLSNLSVGNGGWAGWHILANPYNGALDWDQVTNGADVGPPQNIDPTYWAYDHPLTGAAHYVWYQIGAPAGTGGARDYWDKMDDGVVDGSWGHGKNIPVFRGFYVHATSGTNSIRMKPPGLWGKPAKEQPYDETYWRLRMDVRAGDLTASHRYAAVHPDALAGLDRLDVLDRNEAEGTYLLTYFLVDGERCVQDMRPPGNGRWELVVETNQAPVEVEIAFPDAAEMPPGWAFGLAAPGSGATVAVDGGGTYRYVQETPVEVVGVEGEVVDPAGGEPDGGDEPEPEPEVGTGSWGESQNLEGGCAAGSATASIVQWILAVLVVMLNACLRQVCRRPFEEVKP